ncbi:MAG: PEGA domain-containing protein [Vicinamibacterales bacterium]
MANLDHFEEEPESGSSKLPLIAGAAIAVLVIGGIAWWTMRPEPAEPERPVERVERAAPPPAAAEPTSAPAPVETPRAPVREPRPRPRVEPKVAEVPEAAPVIPAAPERELVVQSDVDGALVFLDRVFLGNAPVRTSEVKPGTHQINVSAQGYDGVAQTVDIAESGETNVTIRLREVRLNEAVEVVHKHGMGSCQGKLVADLSGFRYTPTKGNDGFTITLSDIESFEIDYLKKNLRIKQKGGKTWNFESPTGTADPLFVFHRDVEKARAKLLASR